MPVTSGVLFASWFIAHFVSRFDPAGYYAIHVISLALVADLLRVALGERADDLVEKRRLIRLWLPVLVAAQAGGVLVFETIAGQAAPHPAIQLLSAALILALTLFAVLALLRTDEELLAGAPNPAVAARPAPDLPARSADRRVWQEWVTKCLSQWYPYT